MPTCPKHSRSTVEHEQVDHFRINLEDLGNVAISSELVPANLIHLSSDPLVRVLHCSNKRATDLL